MNCFLKNRKNLVGLIIFLVFLFAGTPLLAQNTTSRVYFKGSASTVTPESIISVSVFVDSKSPINAFDLEISYPKDKLEFLNFDNTDSIVNIWQPAPLVLSNGNLGLTGGIIKAFNGKGGLLIKLSFRAINSSEPKMYFIKSNLYIADGKGTEIKASPEVFSISIRENGQVVSSPIVPFQTTKENILIEKELENFKSKMLWNKILIPVLIFAVTVFVICGRAVYNKRKRKL